MVDNRSAGHFGIGGAFNFKSGDISGTAAKMQDDKMGQGTEYGIIGGEEEQQHENEHFVDRSAQLRATLNSLAMMNVANFLNNEKINKDLNKKKQMSKKELDEEFMDDFEELDPYAESSFSEFQEYEEEY